MNSSTPCTGMSRNFAPGLLVVLVQIWSSAPQMCDYGNNLSKRACHSASFLINNGGGLDVVNAGKCFMVSFCRLSVIQTKHSSVWPRSTCPWNATTLAMWAYPGVHRPSRLTASRCSMRARTLPWVKNGTFFVSWFPHWLTLKGTRSSTTTLKWI